MGCVEGDTLCWKEELPQREIAIKQGFWMTQTEITVGAFRAFLEECSYIPESEIKNQGRIYQNELEDWVWTAGVTWQHPLMEGLPVPDDFPVAQVSWKDANQYCACVGGRLPTEAEWEYAARGGRSGEIYVWGNSPTPLKNGQLQGNGPDAAIPSARYFSHGGSVNDFSSYVMLNDDGTTIIILASTRPLNLLKLLTNIYRTHKGEDISISKRVILPSLKNISSFEKENGIDGVLQYQQVMTKNAGYPVYLSTNYMATTSWLL